MITYPANPELQAAVKVYLLKLLPPERVPAAGGTMDQLVDLSAYGLTQHQIAAIDMLLSWFARFSSPAGLDAIAAAKRLSRFSGENTDALVARLNGAYGFWELAGTKPGIELVTTQLGYENPQVIEHYQTEPSAWAEWSIILYPGETTYQTWLYGQGNWGETLYGAQFTAAEQARVRAVFEQVKPAHTVLRTITYVAAGSVWGGMVYGDPYGATEVLTF